MDGEDAFSNLREHGDIDLVIVDSVMPKKNGREVYEEMHRMDSRVRVLWGKCIYSFRDSLIIASANTLR